MSTKRIRAALDDASPKHPNLSRWILPATAEAYEQMVEQGAMALAQVAYQNAMKSYVPGGIYCEPRKPDQKDIEWFSKYARKVAASWGITSPKKGQP